VRTGYALRVRKSGTVTTYDPETPEKNHQGKRRVGAAAAQRASREARRA
jgi:hypothetical protein